MNDILIRILKSLTYEELRDLSIIMKDIILEKLEERMNFE